MTLFADPSFFVLLAAGVVPAAALGLTEHNLRHWGLVLSALFLTCVFFQTPAQLVALLAFLVVARGAALALARDPKGRVSYPVAVLATLAPLVIYKVSAVFDQSLWGFVGISYVTFKATQVVIEVHDGLIGKKDLGLEDWLYFLLFFPQFSSGPIDRSRRFLADAHATPSRDEYAGMLARGILLLLAGALYKVVKCAYLYGLYLFFDFAGYSLMAMGASYCLGIRCPRNFRAPFLACDIIDFWNRWHITLSTWFRDFVFMRFTRWLMHKRLVSGRVRIAQCAFMVDMLVMGFWHGLAPCYIGYGLYHGVLLAATEWAQKRWGFYRRHRRDAWFRALSWFLTLQLVVLGFAIFSGQIDLLMKGAFNG